MEVSEQATANLEASNAAYGWIDMWIRERCDFSIETYRS